MNLVIRLLSIFLIAASMTAAHAQRAQNALTWGFGGEVETLDPYATGKGTVQLVSRNVLENLVVRDPSGAVRPALATSWRMVNDKTIEFTLRQGVTFHNGQPFDADDVVYTVNYVKRPDSKISSQGDYGFIAGAERVGPYKVNLILSSPTPSAIDRLTQTLYILPKTAHAAMSPAQFGAKPIGTGPYAVTSFEAGRKAELTRYAGYYQADWGTPRLDRITVLSLPDPQTLVAELTSGRVDFVWSVPKDTLPMLKGNPKVATATGASNAIYFLTLDAAGRSGPNPMQDKNVRLAISHAINRAAISEVLRGGGSVVINAPCHPQQFGCAQDVPAYEYDVKKAKAFMKASGYPNGFELSIAAFGEGGPVAEAILGDLAEIGIKGKLEQRETSAWVKDFFAGKFKAAVVPWPSAGVRDVSALTPVFFQGGQGDYVRDPEVTAWFKNAGAISDPAERKRLYRLGFDQLAREAMELPLMTSTVNYGYRAGLDFTPPADGYPLMYMTGWKK
ncbi:ABC transporter substrate-binding protein [Variovorax sp. Sphag1AA]|uniref:ABC transporter substrate-binding protein n=1 Tax=Variovorax sp. Sphag1AA TaxID=2587027 RepID=UPI00161547C0|nr:ABC transporter substrate-binding protein [Variovorax sp. Sphag1AA]MBB3182247.1 peptide/nickel transport system substrate-binding protein [Variovorax sp. Sphag1AA]